MSSKRIKAGAPPPLEDAVRARIIAGARRHFFAHGFRGVTMDDLAVEMRMSKKTLYVHFSSKTALLEAVLQDKLRRAEADMALTLSASGFAAQLHAMLVCVREQANELQPPFIRDMKREALDLFEVVQRGRARLIHRYFGQLLGAGQKAGLIRKDVAREFLVEMLTGVVDGVVHPAKLEELGLTPKTAFTKVIAVFLEGAAIGKGRISK